MKLWISNRMGLFPTVFAVAFWSMAVMAVGSLGGCNDHITDNDITDLPLAQIRKLTESGKPNQVVLIDARSPREFAQGHLPDARNMTLDQFTGRRGDLDPALERFEYQVVYGNDPGSAVAKGVAKRMMIQGYKDVYMFMGGLSEWRRAGLPVRLPDGSTAP